MNLIDPPKPAAISMPSTAMTREQFLEHRLGRTFADVATAREYPFDQVLEFFSDAARQQRMEESELHHDRPPLAGVIREFESMPRIHTFLATGHPRLTQRLRQAVGVIVRIIMERRGWKKTGRKGSLGVRTPVAANSQVPGSHRNSGGLALWFIRGERYELCSGMPYMSVRSRSRQLEDAAAAPPSKKSSRSRRTDAGRPGEQSRTNGTHRTRRPQ